jgi:hypothetical protein
VDRFARIDDPRQVRWVEHQLAVVLALLYVRCGHVAPSRASSKSTIWRVVTEIDPAAADAAMHTQRETAEYLHSRGADFCFCVKENQPKLFATLNALPWNETLIGNTQTNPRSRPRRTPHRFMHRQFESRNHTTILKRPGRAGQVSSRPALW